VQICAFQTCWTVSKNSFSQVFFRFVVLMISILGVFLKSAKTKIEEEEWYDSLKEDEYWQAMAIIFAVEGFDLIL